jgi:mannosyltransferase OCH1-like enzyme
MLLLCGDLMVIGLLLQTIKPLISLMYHNKELFTPQTGLSGLNTSDTWGQVNQSNKIPRILHQTTATEVIPDYWVEPQRSCKNAYLDFEYKVRLFPSINFI